MEQTNATQTISPISKGFQLLGLAISTLLTFMGANYISYGNIWVAASAAVVFLVLFYLIVDRLCYFKKQQQKVNDYTPEIVLMVVFSILALVVMVIHHHYIDTDFNRKHEIKKAGLSKLKELDNLKLAYEQAVSAQVAQMNTTVTTNFNNLKTADRISRIGYVGKLKELLGKAVDDVKLLNTPKDAEADIESARKTKEKTINKTYEQDNLHTEYGEYAKKVQVTFENWSRTKLAYYYYDMDKMYANMHKEYKTKMKEFAYKDKIAINNELNITDPIKSFTSASIMKIMISFVIFIVISAMVLVPYLMVDRPAQINQLVRPKNNNKISGNINIG